jgi:hypothetical protein
VGSNVSPVPVGVKERAPFTARVLSVSVSAVDAVPPKIRRACVRADICTSLLNLAAQK